MFDILAVNEDEVLQILRAMGVETKDEIQAMCCVLESPGEISTVWLHSLYYQASLSTKHERELLEKAQMIAATAGVCRVEKGSYPTTRDIVRRRKRRNYSKKGLEMVSLISKKYSSEIKGAELVVTPCYKARDFMSTVGAGDVASAAYTYVIAGGEI
jgi:ADP-dependent phosphofructokinase/glucokinase